MPVRIESNAVSPVTSVRDLGVHIDSDLTMTSHVIATVRSSFAALRQIRSVRQSPPALADIKRVRGLLSLKSSELPSLTTCQRRNMCIV